MKGSNYVFQMNVPKYQVVQIMEYSIKLYNSKFFNIITLFEILDTKID